MNFDKKRDEPELIKMVQIIQELSFQGHSPATSGNYSCRSAYDSEVIYISESGVNKKYFSIDNFLPFHLKAKKVLVDGSSEFKKVSDETEIHLAIYRNCSAQYILHSHKLVFLLFADLFENQDEICVTGLELLKGFSGVKSHEQRINIPLLKNSQNMSHISELIESYGWQPENFGFILRGHGIYVWGQSLMEVSRHLEVFEYICNYYIHSKKVEFRNDRY